VSQSAYRTRRRCARYAAILAVLVALLAPGALLAGAVELKMSLEAVFPPPEFFGKSREVLTLRDAVLKALSANENIRSARLTPVLRDEIVSSALGRFDPNFRYELNYQYTDDPLNTQQFIGYGGNFPLNDPFIYNSELLVNRASLGAELPTGTRLEIFGTIDELTNDTNTGSPLALFSPEYGGTFGLRIVQPILRGFGPAATMADVRIARADRSIGWLEWKESLENGVGLVAATYYQLALGMENLRVRRDNIRLAEELEAANRRRVELGRMSEFAVLETQSAASLRREEALAAALDVANTMAALRSLIFSPEEIETWTELIPGEPLRYEPDSVDRNSSQLTAREKNTQLRKARLEIEKSRIRTRYFRNQALPELNAFASAAGLSSAGDAGGAAASALDGQGADLTAGLVFSIPLGNVRGRSDLAAAKVQEQKVGHAFADATIRVSSEIDAACTRVLIARQRIEEAGRNLDLAENALVGANRLLVEGKTTSFEVLRFQNNLALARAQRNSAVAEHQTALVALWLREGTLLERFGVRLEEEAWRNSEPTVRQRKNFDAFRKSES